MINFTILSIHPKRVPKWHDFKCNIILEKRSFRNRQVEILKNETNGNDGGDNDYHNTSLSFNIKYIHIIAKND